MQKPKHYLPFLECAQRVIRSRVETPLNDEMAIVGYDCTIIEEFIGRRIPGEDRLALASLFAHNYEDECLMWELAHGIQHMMEDEHETKH